MNDIIKYNHRSMLGFDKRKYLKKTTIELKENIKNKIRFKSFDKNNNEEEEDELLKNNNYIYNNEFKKELNLLSSRAKQRKLCTIKTFFSEKYNLLFVSSTNNKISGWRYYPNLR